jgi:probable rRNA maturation factor
MFELLMKMRVYKEVTSRLPRKRLQRLFDLIDDAELEPDSPGTINVIFTTDRRMTALNRQFRNKNGSTDVLSFKIDDRDEPGFTFGEIYISATIATRQADERGISLAEEFLHLVCHGLLHLCGYDHNTDREAEIMSKLEDNYLRQQKVASSS